MSIYTKEGRLFIVLGCFFVANAIVAEFIGIKIFTVEGTLGLPPLDMTIFGFENLSFNMSAGILNWPIVFIMTDIINEYYGKKGVKFLSFLAIFLIGYAFLVVGLAIWVKPADFWSENNGFDMNLAFNSVFGQSLWNIFGSITAFLIGQLVDVGIFHRIKKYTGERMLWLRATGSTVVSQMVDSFVVTFILFYWNPNFAWTFDRVLAIASVGYFYKFLIAVLITPVLYIVHRIIDAYLGKELSQKMVAEATEK
ncbi:hypothetical protein EDD80_109120 [Anseongella ginsenosidimutans]|uniref:Probable queuosine precursor transporter n=1 Tax=Anseongella ginsenosidimutans TaxID=496056 RepID=A0A4R3KNK7_9SPHI|nr:queuosine precursor transporter [Anseongella ginsenosidimutans]QEC53659.1 queuosine precursor transporter [Anseongella ginsenosidimutans]TCS86091.1 hypothetical protein EDD80_109120 [Anseongella ginsenosidimutans]